MCSSSGWLRSMTRVARRESRTVWRLDIGGAGSTGAQAPASLRGGEIAGFIAEDHALASRHDALSHHDLDRAVRAVQRVVGGRVADVVLFAQFAANGIQRVSQLLKPFCFVNSGRRTQSLVLRRVADLAV